MSHTFRRKQSIVSDRDLLAQFLRDQDDASFERIVARYNRAVFLKCLRVLGKRNDAEDAAQATFMTLYSKRNELEEIRSLEAWLQHVAVCVSRNMRRANIARKARETTTAETQAKAEKFKAAPQNVELRRSMLTELSKLPEMYREPLVLFHLAGLSLKETAQVLNCSIDNASIRLRRGREKLRTRLERQGVDMRAVSLATFFAAAGASQNTQLPGAASTAQQTLGGVSQATKTVRRFANWAVASAAGVAVVATVTLGVGPLQSSLRSAPQPDVIFTPDLIRPHAVGGFGEGQNGIPSSFELSANGTGMKLTGNTWKKIDLNYQITPHTIIEFDYASSQEGEIQGVLFENDDLLEGTAEQPFSFQVFGTQEWGIPEYRYKGAGKMQHFRIPVGKHFTGYFRYLVFINDHDIPKPVANGNFSNVRIYESIPPQITAKAERQKALPSSKNTKS